MSAAPGIDNSMPERVWTLNCISRQIVSGSILALATLAACSPAAFAQSGSYASTPEYKAMIDEIHSPAPSVVFIATGERPVADPALQVKVQEDSRSVKLVAGRTEFLFNKQGRTLRVTNLQTGSVWSIAVGGPPGAPSESNRKTMREGNRWIVSGGGSGECPQLELELFSAHMARLSCAHGAVAVDTQLMLHVQGSTPLFGLGERFWQAGLTETRMDVRPADKFGEPRHNYAYVAIPFVYGPGGLGLYADTVFDTQFQFNAAGQSFDLEIPRHAASFYIFSGDDPKALLTAYTALTGRPQMPPLWSFGPWVTALHGKEAVLETADKLKAAGDPTSALWIYDELDEQNNLGWPLWFNSYYGDARELNDALHARGLKALGYVHPYVREKMMPYNSPSPAYRKGVEEKLLQTDKQGLPAGPAFEPVRTGNIDFTHPAAVDWWQTMLTQAVRDQGWDGWMEDFGEWVADTDHFAAGSGDRISQIYPLLYHKITTRITQQINPSLAPFSRSGSPGSQRFSTVLWGADQTHDWSRDYGLPSVVTAGITAGMSGYSTWGPDILSDGDSKELWIRWAEFGALTAVMRDHPWSQPPGSIDLWHDAETRAIWKKYAVLHSSLLPYFATYADEAHRTGVPIMRHTVLEYPDDPHSATAEYQYLLGKELLVAPVIEQGATTRRLYLPRGQWINYWSGEELTGGKDVMVTAPLEQIPLLVRGGSILPFKPESETAMLQWSDPQLLASSIVWKAYPTKQVEESRMFALPDGTSASLLQRGSEMTIQGKSAMRRPYEIMIACSMVPAAVRLDGNPLPLIEKPGTVGGRSGWWFDSSTHEVHAVFPASNFMLVVSNR